MVIAVGACDNVEWGGIDIDVVPPPSRTPEAAGTEASDALPEGPILFYVHRDTARTTVIPVGQITGDGLEPVTPSGDPDAFGTRFMDAFLAPGTELALFRRGQRVGSVTVGTAAMPAGAVCRPLPRATGTATLTGSAETEEFLALDTAVAPESRAPDGLGRARSMEVTGDMMARRMLAERDVPVTSAAPLRRQLLPFPLADSPDPGFTATYLVDDSLGLGQDDAGAALFALFTPEGQTGYGPAFVGFADYAAGRKAAPRVIDFLDWDRDGSVELLLEVFGTTASWFRAVGRQGEHWGAIFEDQCDPRTAPAPDTADAPGNGEPAGQTPESTRRQRPAARQPTGIEAIPEPTIQLSNPGQTPRLGRDTARDTVPPDTGGGR